MALCEQCGSIQIVRAQPEPADRVVAFFTAKRPFICRRCGWRGRRDWSDADLKGLKDYGAGGAEPDPALAALDLANAAANQPDVAEDSKSIASRASSGRRRRGRKRKRSRRREIVAAIAVAASVMFLVVILGLTGSCGGGGTEGF